jgi:adenosylmethionine-8-amino-7-oxononanoate aminotransferase
VSENPTDVPGWLERGFPHVWLPYTQMKTAPLPLPVAATAGTRLKLADGRELIDGIASWWTACHGYNHPHVVAAMERQVKVMPHVMFGGLNHEPALTLAGRLAAILPKGLARVFFSDSGSVAVEVALKMALQYWINQGIQGRTRFVAFRHAYHGDTLGAMSVCDPTEGMHALFKDHLPKQIIVELPRTREQLADFDSLLARRRNEIAGLIVEPLAQGAGGMRFHVPEVLAAIHAAAARHGILLIADEIFTGFGRTGRLFASEEAGITPDIVCVGKALTGGAVGLAATVASERVFEAFLSDDPAKALMHGPTYMANPLACAAANASLDLFEREPRLRQVADIEAHLRHALEPCRRLPGVVDVRAKGAIGVVEVAKMRDLEWFKRRFVEEGVWLRPFGNIVYTTPPFVIQPKELAAITDAMAKVITEWSRG